MKLFDVYSLFDVAPVRAEGAYLWDNQGRRYLDFYGGHAVISIGHSHPHYVETINRQLSQIGFYSNAVHIPQQQMLADLLGEVCGYPDYQLFLCNSGAEANENALKVASFVTKRKEIIAFSGAFHGRTSAAVAATDNPSIIAPVNETPHIHKLPFNDEEAFRNAMNDGIAAVIVEGIQGVGGICEPSQSFLKTLREECDAHGAMLILDEVQSGYGRTGKFFAHQHAGVRADIISMAKGMGNGFPIGGILISDQIPAKKGMLGTTFGGNYLACAAGTAVLEVMKSEKLMQNAQQMGDILMDFFHRQASVKEVRGRGLMIGIEMDHPVARLRNELLQKHGVFTGSSGNPNVLRLLPPLTIGIEEVNQFTDAFLKSCIAIENETVYERS